MELTNLRPLQVFRMVMQVGSVSEAARRLNVTQPAVSKMLKQMEEGFGFALFKRQRRRLYPSKEADQLYADTERLFGHVASVQERIGALRDAHEGELILSAIPALASSLIARAIGRFRQARPKVKIQLRSHTSQQVVEVLSRHQADLGFVHGPVDNPMVASELMWETEVVCLMLPDNPLAAAEVLEVQDLIDQPLITFASISPPSHLIREAFAAKGQPPAIVVETNLSSAAYALVEAGAGIAIIDPLAKLNSGYPNLVMRPFRPSIRIRTVYLCSRFRPMARLSAAFLTELRSTVAEIAEASPFVSLLGSDSLAIESMTGPSQLK